MSRIVKISCWFLLCLGIVSPIQSAVAADEDIVFVRKDCSSIGSNQQCFNTMEALQNWLWNTRHPTANSRVSVHIGPGEFTPLPGSAYVFRCSPGNGYVSLIGSGPVTTRLYGAGQNAISATDCNDLHVQDMTLETGDGYAVSWNGGGSSRWVNVDVKGRWHAWRDIPQNCGGQHPIHYWFNSRLESTGKLGIGGSTYLTGCGESWFYASEITYLVEENLGSDVFDIQGNANVRVFGSVVRAIVPDGANPNVSQSYITGVKARDNGTFHMHGGIISLDISPLATNADVSGLENYGSGTMHTPDTAFALKAAGSGEVWRTWKQGSGPVLSPFTWPAGTNPPALANQGTLNGSDMFVETDCEASGDCDAGTGNETHLMIYNSTCGNSMPWFDSTRGKCRGAP